MRWINRLQGCPAAEPAGKRMNAIKGTIQRVNYQRREVRVISQGQVWQFVLSADCRLWFNDTPAILRCFHPLDPVTVLYHDVEMGHLVKAIYSWEPQKWAMPARP